MMPSDRIHEALMGFKAQELLSLAHNRDVPAEPRPVVIIVAENLVALSAAGFDSPSIVE